MSGGSDPIAADTSKSILIGKIIPKISVFIGLAAISWMGISSLPAFGASLVLSSDSGKIIACVPLEPGEPIHLDFINSIYRAPVRETFIYKPGEGLVLVQMESPSAGVFEYYGLELPESGSVRLRRRVGELRVLSSDYQNHIITAGRKSIRLKGLVKAGEIAILKADEGGCPCGKFKN